MSSPLPSSLGRLAGILLALAVGPALAFVAVQVFVQSESEKQLADLRDQQLDEILFSVNQSAWDVAAVWADRLARDGSDLEGATSFLEATSAVRSVLEADSAGNPSSFGEVSLWTAAETDRSVVFAPNRVAALRSQLEAGFRKLEPVALEDSSLALVFVDDRGGVGAPPRLFAMVLPASRFIEAAVLPKLNEKSQGGIAFAVFRDGSEEPVESTTRFVRSEAQREEPLWFLSTHVVGARLGGGSVEASLRKRLWQSLLLIGGVTAALGTGAFVVWRGVRREVEVARLREDFVSNVSHELRTPLALIRMYAESLQQGRVPSEKRDRYYSTIVAESERLSRLVGNVLQYNRFERGTATVAQEPVNVSELVVEITERYRPVVQRGGGTLEVALEDVPAVNGDRDLLSEALINLIDNAVKYGGGAVEVATRHDANTVVLEVADRGPGIEDDDLERVFQPFVRLQPESADGLVHTAKGTGLGLALVQRVAVSHGGTVTASPRSGGGTTFRISLPSHV